jgi:phage gp45-like
MSDIESDQKHERMQSRMDNIMSRGTLHSTRIAGTQVAKIGMMAEEINDGVEYPQDYGFISRPPGGSEVIVHHFGGERDHATIS